MENLLDKEMQKYEDELPALLDHEGKYVLIADGKVVDVYDTYSDAIKAGYEKKQLEPFLVEQIKPKEAVFNFTRPVSLACRT